MEQFSDFLPKKKEVIVGEKKLVCKEFSIAKRDAVVKCVLDNLHIVELLDPFRKAFEGIKAGEVPTSIPVNLSEVAESLKGLILKLLSNDLSEISCIALDVPENRKTLGIESNLETNDKHGYEYNKEFFSYVKESLTPAQEQKLLEVIVEVNDFVELIKNYKTLALNLIKKVTGEKKSQG